MWLTVSILACLFLFLLGIHLHQILVPVCPRSRKSNVFQNRAIRSGVMSWNLEAFDSSIWALWELAPAQFAILTLPNQSISWYNCNGWEPEVPIQPRHNDEDTISNHETKVPVPPIIPADNLSGNFLLPLHNIYPSFAQSYLPSCIVARRSTP